MYKKRLDLSGVTGGYLVIDRNVFVLGTKPVTIGRHLENDCVINEPHISRQHAKIEYEHGKYVLYDLDSSSGTFINNKKIACQELNNGDIILLGNYPMMFMFDEISMFEKHSTDTKTLS